jgi:2-(1,2-epoxy-1,2-dihydrophenyl)acetyl-CoA isomerase
MLLTFGQPDYDTAMSDNAVNLIRRGGAAIIEMNSPERMNAWSDRLSSELLQAVEAVADDTSIRAAMVTGAGRAFSSGADLKEGIELFKSGDFDPYRVLTERYHPIITGIREMAKPVVAAVNGPVAGVGVSLALACDLVVATESSYFSLAFVNIGLVPDGGSSLFVPSRVGFARAAEMAILGEPVAAAQAAEWGLINRVYADAVFADEANALLDRLADGPTKSYAGSKRQLNKWMYSNMAQQLEFEADIQREMAVSADFAEGLAAFIEKRPTKFTGA